MPCGCGTRRCARTDGPATGMDIGAHALWAGAGVVLLRRRQPVAAGTVAATMGMAAPLNVPRYTVMNCPIMPASSCSKMWQWTTSGTDDACAAVCTATATVCIASTTNVSRRPRS